MALKSYGTLLEETQAAIDALLSGGQEYELNGRRLRRADLQWLQEREKELIKKLEMYGDVVPGSGGRNISAAVRFV